MTENNGILSALQNPLFFCRIGLCVILSMRSWSPFSDFQGGIGFRGKTIIP